MLVLLKGGRSRGVDRISRGSFKSKRILSTYDDVKEVDTFYAY